MGIEKGRKEGKKRIREERDRGGIVRSLVRGAGTKWRERERGVQGKVI
jgi:hypothetical protein